MDKCCDYEPAKFRHRVAVQSVTESSDGQGGLTETWATVATVWASINPKKGWEKSQAMQIQTPITHEVKMRYRSLTTKQRLLFGSRVFHIKEIINPEERNLFLNLQCVEIA